MNAGVAEVPMLYVDDLVMLRMNGERRLLSVRVTNDCEGEGTPLAPILRRLSESAPGVHIGDVKIYRKGWVIAREHDDVSTEDLIEHGFLKDPVDVGALTS